MESCIDLNQLTKEILVSTDVYGQFWNICVWDYTTGTNLLTYKNCSTVAHGLDFIKDNYMLCAVFNKPYIVYWNLKGKAQPTKINTPGFVTCLAVSPCANYIAIGIEEKVFLLQTYSGKVMSILTRHLQNVTCIKFSHDGDHLITASDDTSILVWNLTDILTTDKEYLKPVHIWDGHSMKINDLFVSSTSDQIVSASADLTCKFWSLNSDKSFNTMSALFQAIPTSCILDQSETSLYVGLANGAIFCVLIKNVLSDPNKLITEESSNKAFLGHNQKITCLSVSSDEMNLASGSDDSTIRIWNILSRQCVKIITHNGALTNLDFKPRTFFINEEQNLEPPLFNRYVSEKNAEVVECVKSNWINETLKLEKFAKDDIDFTSSSSSDKYLEEYFELKSKYENTKKINNKIYNFAIEKILNKNN